MLLSPITFMETGEMQVVIIDMTGSVGDEHINAATHYGCSILNGGVADDRFEIVSSVQWTGTDVRTGRPVYLEQLVEAFRRFDPKCIIHFITDGLVSEAEIRGIDHIYVHEEFVSMLPEYVRSVMTSIVPKHYMMETDDA